VSLQGLPKDMIAILAEPFGCITLKQQQANQ
jgi:hypothetical protein